MNNTCKRASHPHQCMAARIYRSNPASIIRLVVFALTVQPLVPLAHAQSMPTAAAGTAVTTTGGTANHVSKFSGANTIVNSAITE